MTLDDLSILAVPLVAGVIVLASHARLGSAVLSRGIVFIDLAVAQIAALGAMAADRIAHLAVDAGSDAKSHALLHADDGAGWTTIVAGAVAALLGAQAIAALGNRFPAWREAVIGMLYVGAAVATLLFASADPEGLHTLSRMLSGDVLWAQPADLWPIGVATIAYLVLRRVAGDRAADSDRLFYPAFAILVSLSVPLLGVYLVFASLIAPALLRAARPGIGPWSAVAIASVAWAAGLLLSLVADLPSGPSIVVALLVLVALALRSHAKDDGRSAD